MPPPLEKEPGNGAPAAAGAGVTGIEAARRRRRSRVSWPAVSGWAPAAALAGLGVHSVQQQHRIDALAPQVAAVQQVLSAPDVHAASCAVRTGGTALVLDSRRRDEAVISLSALPAPGAGKAYQLWMIGPSGARSGGVLVLPASGDPSPLVAHGLGEATSIAVTIEPAHGSAQPTTAPILLLPMGA